MKFSRGVQEGPQKVVVYGPEGIGKSTFGAQFPDPLFLDVENGTAHIDVARVDPSPGSWPVLLETVREFLREKPQEFSTLVLDTADWAEQMCIRHVCEKSQKDGIEGFGYGKGYVYAAEEFSKLLTMFNDAIKAGYNVVVLAHAKMRKFEQPDEMGAYDRWEMKLTRNIAPILKEWADMVLFCNYKTMVVTTQDGKTKAQGQGKRVVYTTHHSCWDAKNRHGLPDELPLDYSQIAHCIPTRTAAPERKKPKKKEPDPPDDVSLCSPDIPAELASRMLEAKVTESEVRQVIDKTGHFSGDTPWKTLEEQGYIAGYILPNWDYFVKTIESDPYRLPF